jgi:hypothetical protein
MAQSNCFRERRTASVNTATPNTVSGSRFGHRTQSDGQRRRRGELRRPRRHQGFGSRMPTFFLSSWKYAPATRCTSAAETARIEPRYRSLSA